MSEKDINTEILVRLARIEENTKGFDRVSEKADLAYSTSLQNKKEIEDIKANNKWAWGFIISLALTIVGYFLTRGVI